MTEDSFFFLHYLHHFIGGYSEEDPPVPIPNTEVKLFCADGTAWATMWESRSPPISFTGIKNPDQILLIGFFLLAFFIV